ncbi:MAG: 4-hydroxy-tetrahydrodipicolinate reductase [Deltaproteobacteria bacterium]|nr:4-hydroxy-tetrahydrodipicolinate reductase [Deltaproteobacteria bacterium]
MVKIVVTGAAGRMGRSIINVVRETNETELVGAVERPGYADIGKDAGEVAGSGKLGVKLTDNFEKAIKKADCVIDFTFPEATMHHLDIALKSDVAMVIGTTGFSHHQRERLKEVGGQMQIVAAPNMSVGVNLLLKIVSDMARVLGRDYDVEIIEAHHRLKKDAIQTIRAGDIVGDHTIIFGGLGERMEVTHRAQSRETFARGAVRAAQWVVKQPKGLYDMQDVLGLK